MRTRLLPAGLVLLLVIALPVAAKDDPEPRTDADRLKESLLTEEDQEIRLMSAIRLAERHPDALATALDELVKGKREDSAELLVGAAVGTKIRHTRLLLVWAAAELADVVPLVNDRIDNDRPLESRRAIEALAYIGDSSVVGRLMDLIRNPDEQLALQATRAIARLGSKRELKDLVDAALSIDSEHIRTHVVWAIQDIAGSAGSASKLFARYARQETTPGYRAKDAMDLLEYADAPPEKYKVKFATIRKLFNPKRGAKMPEISGHGDYVERLRGILESMREKEPGYFHLVCTAVEKIQVSKEAWTISHEQRAVNLRPNRIERWDRDELFNYYLIQYASILFLRQLGDPGLGHRGWEEGVMDGWQYALDCGKIGVAKDPNEFFKGVVADPPWGE